MTNARDYYVIWMEDNDEGAPEHWLGISPRFDSKNKAQAWIEETVKEDRSRHGDAGYDESWEDDYSLDIRHTYGNTQHCYYRIVDVPKADEKALKALAEVEQTLNQYVGDPGVAAHAARKVIDKWNKELGIKPLKKYLVNVKCSPSFGVWQKARSAEEAEDLVATQLDNGMFLLDEAQKEEIMSQVTNSVENVHCIESIEDNKRKKD